MSEPVFLAMVALLCVAGVLLTAYNLVAILAHWRQP